VRLDYSLGWSPAPAWRPPDGGPGIHENNRPALKALPKSILGRGSYCPNGNALFSAFDMAAAQTVVDQQNGELSLAEHLRCRILLKTVSPLNGEKFFNTRDAK
jgi:hypothetical protein